jgi:tetratricopeptide (TPR) repeat protein
VHSVFHEEGVMKIPRIGRTTGSGKSGDLAGFTTLLLVVVSACSSDISSADKLQGVVATQDRVLPAPPTPPVVPLPFNDAVIRAADALFSSTQLGQPGASGRYTLVIDPLIDNATGAQLAATRSMEASIATLVSDKYKQFDLQPFNTETVAQSPLVLLGSFAGVDKAGKPSVLKDSYRIWLVLADLRSGTIVARGVARALPDGVDIVPTTFFNDSPGWAPDALTQAYLKTCESKPGERIDPAYLDGILAAALLGDAIAAYDAGRYREALDLYESALRMPGGDQLRAYNGVYLANWKLGRRDRAAEAFRQIVDYGLGRNRLAVKFLFRRGSTAFFSGHESNAAYDLWLREITRGVIARNVCLEIEGHTSPTGPPLLNDRLSLARAEYVKARLEEDSPINNRVFAEGRGSREPIVGTGTDDAADALDRRVEFKPFAC